MVLLAAAAGKPNQMECCRFNSKGPALEAGWARFAGSKVGGLARRFRAEAASDARCSIGCARELPAQISVLDLGLAAWRTANSERLRDS